MTTERDSSAGEDAGGRSEAADNRPRSPGKPVGEPGSPDPAETLIKPATEPVAPPRQSGAGVATPRDEDVPAEWEPGMVILDPYEVKEELGRGTFGTVHKVHHKGWNVDLAVKSALGHVGEEDIVREAEVWMELGLHPNLVSCHFVRPPGGIPRIFVEYVEGGSLSGWGRNRKLYEGGPDKAIERILDIAIQFAWGLHYAHEQGLAHQDVKPANVMMTPDGAAKALMERNQVPRKDLESLLAASPSEEYAASPLRDNR